MAAWQAGVALLAPFIRSMQYAHGSGAACQAKAGIALRAGWPCRSAHGSSAAYLCIAGRDGFWGFTGVCAAMCPIA